MMPELAGKPGTVPACRWTLIRPDGWLPFGTPYLGKDWNESERIRKVASSSSQERSERRDQYPTDEA